MFLRGTTCQKSTRTCAHRSAHKPLVQYCSHLSLVVTMVNRLPFGKQVVDTPLRCCVETQKETDEKRTWKVCGGDANLQMLRAFRQSPRHVSATFFAISSMALLSKTRSTSPPRRSRMMAAICSAVYALKLIVSGVMFFVAKLGSRRCGRSSVLAIPAIMTRELRMCGTS
jgi:hypothetical protein